jgi:large subunit ribosomal protein L31
VHCGKISYCPARERKLKFAPFYTPDISRGAEMKADIHPEYKAVAVTCSCGNSFETRSTIGKEQLSVEVCSQCHPFYTGKQKIMDTAGQVDKFRRRYGGK